MSHHHTQCHIIASGMKTRILACVICGGGYMCAQKPCAWSVVARLIEHINNENKYYMDSPMRQDAEQVVSVATCYIIYI